MRYAAATIAALVVLMVSGAAAQAAGCSVAVGTRVMLKARTIDPDVLVWDRKDLLIAYASGIWPGTKTVLQHALLSSPGTPAITRACAAAAIRPAHAAAEDAIAIRITGGPHRGREGWVAAADVHVIRVVHRL